MRVFAIVAMVGFGLIALIGAVLMIAMFLAKVSGRNGRKRWGRLVLEDRAVTLIGVALFLFGIVMVAVGAYVLFIH